MRWETSVGNALRGSVACFPGVRERPLRDLRFGDVARDDGREEGRDDGLDDGREKPGDPGTEN